MPSRHRWWTSGQRRTRDAPAARPAWRQVHVHEKLHGWRSGTSTSSARHAAASRRSPPLLRLLSTNLTPLATDGRDVRTRKAATAQRTCTSTCLAFLAQRLFFTAVSNWDWPRLPLETAFREGCSCFGTPQSATRNRVSAAPESESPVGVPESLAVSSNPPWTSGRGRLQHHEQET